MLSDVLIPMLDPRLAADRAYVAALRQASERDDPRLAQEWLVAVHRGNLESASR